MGGCLLIRIAEHWRLLAFVVSGHCRGRGERRLLTELALVREWWFAVAIYWQSSPATRSENLVAPWWLEREEEGFEMKSRSDIPNSAASGTASAHVIERASLQRNGRAG